MPDIAAFYTTEELKKKSYAEIEKIHCFMFGNGGTPSVRDARFGKESKYFSPDKAFSYLLILSTNLTSKFHRVDDGREEHSQRAPP